MKRAFSERKEMVETQFDSTFRPNSQHKQICFKNPYIQDVPYSNISTFSQILQKQNADSRELRNFVLDDDFDNHLEFQKIITNHEYKINNDFSNNLVKSLLFTFAIIDDLNDVIQKYKYLQTILSNSFLSDDIQVKFYNRFSDAQRAYAALNRLAFIYKWRRSSPKICTDLCLDPISQKERNVMSVLHNDQKYLFTISDITRIVETSLCNSPYFFTEPLPIKNPYTNIPFDKSHLYNMYFFIKARVINISPVFHAYFMANFNLKKFRDLNGVLITNMYIKQFIKNSDNATIYYDIVDMLKTIPFRGKIQIDKDFPRNRLIEIMTPYLESYYTSKISNDISARNSAKRDLSRRLTAFYKYNKNFGRKFIVVENRSLTNRFSDDHLPYRRSYEFCDFDISHLDIDDTEPNYTSSTVSNDSFQETVRFGNNSLRRTRPNSVREESRSPRSRSITEEELIGERILEERHTLQDAETRIQNIAGRILTNINNYNLDIILNTESRPTTPTINHQIWTYSLSDSDEETSETEETEENEENYDP